jgi:hypothetical protein
MASRFWARERKLRIESSSIGMVLERIQNLVFLVLEMLLGIL